MDRSTALLGDSSVRHLAALRPSSVAHWVLPPNRGANEVVELTYSALFICGSSQLVASRMVVPLPSPKSTGAALRHLATRLHS